MCDGFFHASGWQVLDQTRRTQHRFEVAMDQSLETYGISYAQYRALEVLFAANGDMHVSELARRLRLSRQSAALSVEKLARAGFVVTEREPHQLYIVLTGYARQHIRLIRRFASTPVELEAHLGSHELGSLVALLRRADDAAHPPNRPTWWLAD